MPPIVPAPRALILRLAAIVAVGWLMACASSGVGHDGRPGTHRERTTASLGDRHGHIVDLRVSSGVQSSDDRDDEDDDERWKSFQLAGIAATWCIGHEPGLLSADLLRIGFPFPPRGPTSPRLRC